MRLKISLKNRCSSRLKVPAKVILPTIEKMIANFSSGSLRAEDLFHGLRENIEAFDRGINSFTYLAEPSRHGRPAGPLYGLPVAVKDIIDTVGIPTEYGSQIFAGNLPKTDAAVIRNVKRSGGLIQGKTSTHEFAMGIVTPQSRNPWDTERITGGSSGGSAAALAAGFAVFAIGTDTAGSIRIPAAFCGITGLKPSTGKLPLKGIYPEAWSLDTLGPMCRYASDLPLLLRSMGYVPGKGKPWKGKPAATITNLVEGASPGIRRAFNGFIDTLNSEGLLQMEEISIPELEEISMLDDLIDSAENSQIQKELFQKYPEKFTDLSREQLEYASQIKASDYISAQRARKKYIGLFRELHKKYRFLLSPAQPAIAPKFREIKDAHPAFYMKYMSYTSLYNFSRDPAVSVPVGFDAGMPAGAQLSASWGEDSILIGLAVAYQEISDHHLMYPEFVANHVRKLSDCLSG